MNRCEAVDNSSYIIKDDLIHVVVNEGYSQALSKNKVERDYSYISLFNDSIVDTIGFSRDWIKTLVDDVNKKKFKNFNSLHLFDVELKSREFVHQSDSMDIIPYIHIDETNEKTLSVLSKKLVSFIEELNKTESVGIIVSFFRDYNEGESLKNYASHVTPLLVVPDKNKFVVFIFDDTGFQLMGSQEEYQVIQVPNLRNSRSNCCSFSFAILEESLSNPEMINDLLAKRTSVSDLLITFLLISIENNKKKFIKTRFV